MPEQEEWRPVVGFPGYYVSNLGRVRSHRRRPPRIMSTPIHKTGYRYLTFKYAGEPKTVKVHRLVAEAFHGSPPEGHVARHLNGDPLDNRAENLAWGTWSDNSLDAVGHGTHPMARKTRCPQGHAYDEANTKVYRGMRYCRACSRARSNADSRRVRGAAKAAA